MCRCPFANFEITAHSSLDVDVGADGESEANPKTTRKQCRRVVREGEPVCLRSGKAFEDMISLRLHALFALVPPNSAADRGSTELIVRLFQRDADGEHVRLEATDPLNGVGVRRVRCGGLPTRSDVASLSLPPPENV